MKALFPIRTGDLNYTINVKAPNNTGKWSVELGFSGMAENTWGISGCSGKIYDNTGYNIGSYIANQSTSISGSIFDERHSVYQDGVLLSNQSRHSRNDYDMVEIKSSYINGYTPDVNIQGRSVLNTNSKETHEFWSNPKDRIYFVTENAQADNGFVQQLRSMGFTVHTGDQSGVGGGQSLDSFYSLIIFGSATSSGNYNSGFWNSLNTNMMSLNSHLVTDQNLQWYEDFSETIGVGSVNPSVQKDINQYAKKFPPDIVTSGGSVIQGETGQSPQHIWVETFDAGWVKLYYNATYSTPPSGPSDPNRAVYTPFADTFTDPTNPSFESSENQKYFIIELEADTLQMQYGRGARMAQNINFGSAIFGAEKYSGFFHSERGQGGIKNDFALSSTWASEFVGASYRGMVSSRLGGLMNGTCVLEAADTSDCRDDRRHQGDTWNNFKERGRIDPQYRTYPVDIIYRDLPIDESTDIPIYTGVVETSHGPGGEGLLYSSNNGQPLCVWHQGFITGRVGGDYGNVNTDTNPWGTNTFCKKNLLCFSVTPTGNDWTTGYDMWSTLTPTGQRIFVNSVVGFFV
ncbi:MAG: hypothetical protein ACW99F_04350 [Candidatus Hodarchaeales archaeon]|jgi:hypothetical protein